MVKNTDKLNSITKPLYDTGVIHGRFQVLHNDHMRYLLSGLELCSHLIVGITNPDPVLSADENSDPERNSQQSNPLTYYERYLMIQSAFSGRGIPAEMYSIVPFPINKPELIKHYTPEDAVYFLTIYDDWGREKLARLKSFGYKTHVLWEVSPDEKGINASDVRDLIASEEKFEHLVPAETAGLIQKWDIRSRLLNPG